MTILDKIKKDFTDIVTFDDIEDTMNSYGYHFVEDNDSDEEENILKYSNNKSQLWLRYTKVKAGSKYLIMDITRANKKRGKTEADPIWREEDLRNLMVYFKQNYDPEEFLIFILEILLARRVADTISLKWSDFYYENGKKKDILDTLIEQKTDKIISIAITDTTWKYIDSYCKNTGLIPMDHYNSYLFISDEGDIQKNISNRCTLFRRRLKKAADYCGIPNISTHSLRKTFGHYVYMLNRFDPDCLIVEQSIFGHDSIETTKRYIGIMKQKSIKYFNDIGTFIEEVEDGKAHSIDNMPVIAIKTNDLRSIIYEAIKAGRESDGDMGELLNGFISRIEECRMM